jgi:hypothetical protein
MWRHAAKMSTITPRSTRKTPSGSESIPPFATFVLKYYARETHASAPSAHFRLLQLAFASLQSYKKFNTRGIPQLAINSTHVDATLDQHAATDSYATNDYGTFTFSTVRRRMFLLHTLLLSELP